MNQSQTVDLQVKLCLVLANSEPTVKRISTAQTFKDLHAHCLAMMKNANIPSNLKTSVSYKDSDGDKIDVSDDYELQMAYATALSADSKVKFYLEVPDFVPAQPVAMPVPEEPVQIELEEPLKVESPVPVVEEPVAEDQQPVEIQAELEDASSDENMHHHHHHGKKGKKGKGKKGKKGKCGGPGGANMPRKAIKNLIRAELETAVPGLFDKLIKEQEEPSTEESKDEQPVVHTDVECDSCGVCPILGIRYKCSVRKDFDLCSKCEESLVHPYPFLKIRKAGGAPSMIITVLNEDNQGNPTQPDWKEMKQCWQQIREQCKPQKRQNREWTEEECQKKGQFWKNMVGGFMEKMGMDKDKVDFGQMKNNWHKMKEEWKQNCGKQDWDKQDWCQMKNNWCQMKQDWKEKHGDDWKKMKQEWRQQHCGDFKGGHGQHKMRRAVVMKKLDQEIQCMPGCVQLVEVEVQNQTNWPWKQGCFLSLADLIDQTNMPIEHINVPVDQKVEANQVYTITVPICVLESAQPGTTFDFSLRFRGPRGSEFGEPVQLKLKVMSQPTPVPQVIAPEPVKKSHLELVKLAVKLFDEEKLGQTFNECLEVVTQVNGDEEVARKALQPRQ